MMNRFKLFLRHFNSPHNSTSSDKTNYAVFSANKNPEARFSCTSNLLPLRIVQENLALRKGRLKKMQIPPNLVVNKNNLSDSLKYVIILQFQISYTKEAENES